MIVVMPVRRIGPLLKAALIVDNEFTDAVETVHMSRIADTIEDVVRKLDLKEGQTMTIRVEVPDAE